MRKTIPIILALLLLSVGLLTQDLSGTQDNISTFYAEITSTDKDIRMVVKISLALSYASIIDKQYILPKEIVWVIVKGARPRYEQLKPDMPFFVYVWLIIKQKYSCCDKWIKYYWRFKNE